MPNLDMLLFTKETIMDVNEIFEKGSVSKKIIQIKKENMPFILSSEFPLENFDRTYVEAILYKSEEDTIFLRRLLEKYLFSRNRNFAVAKVLEHSNDAFSYDLSIEKHAPGNWCS
jgi:hypothetical protein